MAIMRASRLGGLSDLGDGVVLKMARRIDVLISRCRRPIGAK